jgi:hypothetical protein
VSNILVPVDFSKHSELALKLADQIKESAPDSNITGCHLFQIPLGYSKTGKTDKEMEVLMRKHAQKDFTRFMKKCGLLKNVNQRIDPEQL